MDKSNAQEVLDRLAQRTQEAKARKARRKELAERNRKREPVLAKFIDELRAEGFEVKVDKLRWEDER